jgi:hypothetical protein
MMNARQARMQEIDNESRQLRKKLDALHEERSKLRLAQEKEEHPCECVRLNKDVEIFDMVEQERRGRHPLSCGGMVADTLTARKDCQECGGTGKPAPKHNHFGESFEPSTCSACRLLQRNID